MPLEGAYATHQSCPTKRMGSNMRGNHFDPSVYSLTRHAPTFDRHPSPVLASLSAHRRDGGDAHLRATPRSWDLIERLWSPGVIVISCPSTVAGARVFHVFISRKSTHPQAASYASCPTRLKQAGRRGPWLLRRVFRFRRSRRCGDGSSTRCAI